MTGRFEYHHEKGGEPYIYDKMDNRMILDLKCACELLNNISNENENLKVTVKSSAEMLSVDFKELQRLRKIEKEYEKEQWDKFVNNGW